MKIVMLATLVLASVGARTDARDGWDKVRKLHYGEVVRVMMRDGGLVEGHLGLVDADRIVVLSVSGLPPDARRALLDVAKNHRGYIGEEPHFVHKKLRVDRTAIFYGDARVADADAVLRDIRRDAIGEIQRKRHGSLLGGLLGVVVGGAAGFLTALTTIYKDCGGSCADEETVVALSLAGMPIAGGYIGAKAMPHSAWATVYRGR